MTTPSPFHEGEQRVQTRLGVREEIEPWARRVVRSSLPAEHQRFYAQLPFLVVAARDGEGRPWATLLAGEPGFVSSSEPSGSKGLRIGAMPSPGDALAEGLELGADVGVLGIELHSRRRNRVNGRVGGRDGGGFLLDVEQSFGNCPQYITERSWKMAEDSVPSAPAQRSESLSGEQRGLVEGADTFFIATGYRPSDSESETYGMDASHRGGSAGFVRVEDEKTLVFPDYAGNNHFNTIGNLELDPRVGILFVDFEGGDLLQITGQAEIDWEPAPDRLAEFPGARRLVRIRIEEAILLAGVLPLRFGSAGETIRELRLVEKRRESQDVTSFYFEPRDDGSLPDFIAGQYLPIELEIPGQAAPAVRTYSLSGAPGDGRYRISVKRHDEGLASRHLHDQLEVGRFVSARTPQGDFVLDDSSPRPVVLVSAGVGLTPLVSMLHSLVEAGRETPVWFVHGASDGSHHPLRDEVAELVERGRNVQQHIAYSRPRAQDELERDYQSAGRIDAVLLEKLVPDLSADFYLCGPLPFMASIQDSLLARGVSAERIHSEAF